MHIFPHLGVFWRSTDTIQIGTDPRVGVIVEGLTPGEQKIVAYLTLPRTSVEIASEAGRHMISPQRLREIIRMLALAGVVCLEREAEYFGVEDIATHPRTPPALTCTVCSPPRARLPHGIRIMSLDPIGVEIGVLLARSGAQRIVAEDETPVGEADHPKLWPRYAGVPRTRAFLTAIRHVNPHIETQGHCRCAVVTGSRVLPPRSVDSLMRERVPHLLVHAETSGIHIGPLVEPGMSACLGCVSHARADLDPRWAYVAPQAALAPPIPLTADLLAFSAAISVHVLREYLSGHGNLLENSSYQVSNGCGLPSLRSVHPHPACGCLADRLPGMPAGARSSTPELSATPSTDHQAAVPALIPQ